jgi:hypothetical protein
MSEEAAKWYKNSNPQPPFPTQTVVEMLAEQNQRDRWAMEDASPSSTSGGPKFGRGPSI